MPAINKEGVYVIMFYGYAPGWILYIRNNEDSFPRMELYIGGQFQIKHHEQDQKLCPKPQVLR